MHTGIVGFIIFIGFAIVLVLKPLRFARISFRHPYQSVLRNLPVLIPAVLLINSGTQFWGFQVGGARAILLAAYIAISGYYIREVRNSILKNEMGDKSDETINRYN